MDMPLRNYQIGLAMVGLIVVLAIVGYTTHENWIAVVILAIIVAVGTAGIVRGYRNRNR
jgi:ABC-type dipeptide/oligopeptide/nickel transport system permease subunit